MTTYIRFTDADFTHLNEDTAYSVACIVNRKDFQDAVFTIRRTHAVMPFDRARISRDVLAMRGHPQNALDYDPSRPADFTEAMHCGDNEKLYEDVRSILTDLGREQDGLWEYLLFSVARFGIIPQVKQHENIQRPDDKAERSFLQSVGLHPPGLEDLEAVYRRVDELEEQGKIEEAHILLKEHEWMFTASGGVEAWGDRGDVVLRISPQAGEDFIHRVVTATKGYRQHFREKGNFGSKSHPGPNMMKEMVMLADHCGDNGAGMSDNEISAYLNSTYRVSISAVKVRKCLERARAMGF